LREKGQRFRQDAWLEEFSETIKRVGVGAKRMNKQLLGWAKNAKRKRESNERSHIHGSKTEGDSRRGVKEKDQTKKAGQRHTVGEWNKKPIPEGRQANISREGSEV